MSLPRLSDVLAVRSYPGRGVLAARTGDSRVALCYFLTGRSPASRARRLERLDGGDVRVADTSGGEPDKLRHYTALARRGEVLVIGNGSQVEPLADDLVGGAGIEAAWARHEYEPDPPIHTPRIWVTWTASRPRAVTFGLAGRNARDGSTDRVARTVDELPSGTGVLLTTYAGTAAEVRTVDAPVDVTTDALDGAGLLDDVWVALSAQRRVAAFVVDPADPRGSWVARPVADEHR